LGEDPHYQDKYFFPFVSVCLFFFNLIYALKKKSEKLEKPNKNLLAVLRSLLSLSVFTFRVCPKIKKPNKKSVQVCFQFSLL
jgi:hypothetical protein